jgi:hypothetical protein
MTTNAKAIRRVRQISKKLHKSWKRGERRYRHLGLALYRAQIDRYAERKAVKG